MVAAKRYYKNGRQATRQTDHRLWNVHHPSGVLTQVRPTGTRSRPRRIRLLLLFISFRIHVDLSAIYVIGL